MTGVGVEETTFRTQEVKYITAESEKILNEIMDMIKVIALDDGEEVIKLWLHEERGTFTEYKRSRYYDKSIDTKETFLRDYPEKTMWFPFYATEHDNVKYVWIHNLSFRINEERLPDNHAFEQDFTKILTWAKTAVERAIQELKDGTYNERVAKELPYKYRYGTIKRNVFWKYYPDDKRESLEGLTDNEIKEFMNVVKDNELHLENAIEDMTFNKYFDMALTCYKELGYEIFESVPRTFFKYGEDFGGGVLESEIDFDSVQDFNNFFDGKCGNMGGHPWGIIRGSSRTRINLYPERHVNKFCFHLSGNPNWNVKSLVKCYIALKKINAPFYIYNPQEIIDYLDEVDLLGFVSRDDFPAYCQLSFPNQKVNDFRHFYDESNSEIKNLIDWQKIKEVKLKQ